MRKYNILVFPCSTEIANEIISSLRDHKYFKMYYASSEVKGYCDYRYVDVHQLPFIDHPDFILKINELTEKLEIDFIIPAHDDVAFGLSSISSELKVSVIGQSAAINRIVRFKDATYKLFKDMLPIPAIYSCKTNIPSYPVFVKPKKGQGSLNAVKINSASEYDRFFTEFDENEFLVMENLTGTEFTIDCFSDSGSVLYSGARTREKTIRGISVQSTMVRDDELNSEFRKFAQLISSELRMHGLWFFQMKLDINGKLKLLEVAPRVSGTMMLNRACGVNFVELAIYQALGFKVDVLSSGFDISVGRALEPRYLFNISYNNLYVDFDDTLYLDESKINTNLIRLIFQAKNERKQVHLITKNVKNNLIAVLHHYGITNIFDSIIHLAQGESKSERMLPASLLVDDSYTERREAAAKGHFVFSVDNFNILLHD